jgi:hypothetical protein
VTTTPLLTVVVVYAEDVINVFALPWAVVDLLDGSGSDGDGDGGVLLGVDDVEGDNEVETEVGVVELGV